MLSNILSWSPDSKTLVYSRLNGNERRIYFYDKMDEVSYPSQFPNPSKWFELQYIHEEQILVHDWEKGFIVYDTIEKRSQLMLKEKQALSYEFSETNKNLTVCNQMETYVYDPIKRKKTVVSKNLREILIDSVHKTFITIDSNSTLIIYYKNENIFSHENSYGIYSNNELTELYFFTNTHLNILDLNSLKIIKEIEICGTVQNANLNSTIFHFTTLENDVYNIYTFDIKKSHLNLIKKINHTNQLFTSLSPDTMSIAVISDLDIDTKVSILSTFK